MKFYFEDLVLWLKNGKSRTLRFEPDKINIITGDSNTGKTAILDIIDYCLFASQHKISESMINENIEWYGIRFQINGKRYTIARKAPIGNTVSEDYYFSSIGELPIEFPKSNTTEKSLKTTLESDFKIDRDTKISYGGKTLKANSRVSIRYFLLFNTISQDIITHSEEFFDKQKHARYREALPRTFDLAVGIDTTENILKGERRIEIEGEIRKLERQEAQLGRKQETFYDELASMVKQAKEYDLIQDNINLEDAVSQLRLMTIRAEANASTGMNTSEKYEAIDKKITLLRKKIRNIKRFSIEYQRYKDNLGETADSLKPIQFLSDRHSEVLKTSIYHELITSLNSEFTTIKSAIRAKTPLDGNVSDIIKGYEEEIERLNNERLMYPEDIKTFQNNKEKYIFIGEIKAKLALYEKEHGTNDGYRKQKKQELQDELEELSIQPVENKRELFIKVLDETIQEYIDKTQTALENYGGYRSSFNYKEKRLQLRKPKTDFIENIGSSSNHMFLHLFLFLGLHALILKNNSPHVPPFLIIDQFSRPYWGEGDTKKEELDHSDISKVKSALVLLNDFIQEIKDSDHSFQMIIFEHIPKELWQGMNNIHLVEEFKDGNALIPRAMLSTS